MTRSCEFVDLEMQNEMSECCLAWDRRRHQVSTVSREIVPSNVT
jgi:hypothetical protein